MFSTRTVTFTLGRTGRLTGPWDAGWPNEIVARQITRKIETDEWRILPSLRLSGLWNALDQE
jgi:hypothetical protein